MLSVRRGATSFGYAAAAAACAGPWLARPMLRAAAGPAGAATKPAAVLLGGLSCAAQNLGLLGRCAGIDLPSRRLFYAGIALSLLPLAGAYAALTPALLGMSLGPLLGACALFEAQACGSRPQAVRFALAGVLGMVAGPFGWWLAAGAAGIPAAAHAAILGATLIYGLAGARMATYLYFRVGVPAAYAARFMPLPARLQAARLDLPGTLHPTVFGVPEPVRQLVATVRQRQQAGGPAEVCSLLLHGPSGVGKTSLAMGIAQAIDGLFYAPSAADLRADDLANCSFCYMNLLAVLVQGMQQARLQRRPLVLFLDDVDALVPSLRAYMTPQTKHLNDIIGLVTLKDGLRACLQLAEGGVDVVLLAATNHVEQISLPRLREFAGRATTTHLLCYVGPPNRQALSGILSSQLRAVHRSLDQAGLRLPAPSASTLACIVNLAAQGGATGQQMAHVVEHYGLRCLARLEAGTTPAPANLDVWAQATLMQCANQRFGDVAAAPEDDALPRRDVAAEGEGDWQTVLRRLVAPENLLRAVRTSWRSEIDSAVTNPAAQARASMAASRWEDAVVQTKLQLAQAACNRL
jgi:hypothetical protein